GIALGGVLRDLATWFTGDAHAYVFVYSLEVVLLLATLWVMAPLLRIPSTRPSPLGMADHS
ncbi:MAG: hypothetical protein RL258_94, partial [Pseudomonadota bacterium]